MNRKPELEHVGVKGMRWGVRKKRGSSKSVKTLSDAELKTRINRLNLEAQYNKLTTSRGKNYANRFLDISVGIVSGQVASGVISAIKFAIKNR